MGLSEEFVIYMFMPRGNLMEIPSRFHVPLQMRSE